MLFCSTGSPATIGGSGSSDKQPTEETMTAPLASIKEETPPPKFIPFIRARTARVFLIISTVYAILYWLVFGILIFMYRSLVTGGRGTPD